MPEVPYTQPPPRPEARRALEREALLPHIRHEAEIARGLELGLPGADSIVDRSIPTFSRGDLPSYAGINTFLKAPFVEEVRTCGDYDVAVLGALTTRAPPTGLAPGSVPRACAASPRSRDLQLRAGG